MSNLMYYDQVLTDIPSSPIPASVNKRPALNRKGNKNFNWKDTSLRSKYKISSMNSIKYKKQKIDLLIGLNCIT